MSRPTPTASSAVDRPVGVAVVGAGYWGPNLARNAGSRPETELTWVVDLDTDKARRVVGPRSLVGVTDDLFEVLDDPETEAIAIATPAATHLEIALAALEAGKHVLVEKPLAATVAEGEKLVEVARERGLTLMCDHTFCYTPVVQEIRRCIAAGELGQVQYVDSVRINLGLVQPDVDVFWDLAPHDLSILDFVLPEGRRPVSISATGADPMGVGQTCVGYLTLELEGGGIAHVHVNWLSPKKIRTTVVGGSEKMLLWDDVNPAQRLSVFDTGVDVLTAGSSADDARTKVAYRTGDMVAPALPETEALGSMMAELATSIREGRAPLTDGEAGLRVLKQLAAAGESLAAGGAPVPLA